MSSSLCMIFLCDAAGHRSSNSYNLTVVSGVLGATVLFLLIVILMLCAIICKQSLRGQKQKDLLSHIILKEHGSEETALRHVSTRIRLEPLLYPLWVNIDHYCRGSSVIHNAWILSTMIMLSLLRQPLKGLTNEEDLSIYYYSYSMP